MANVAGAVSASPSHLLFLKITRWRARWPDDRTSAEQRNNLLWKAADGLQKLCFAAASPCLRLHSRAAPYNSPVFPSLNDLASCTSAFPTDPTDVIAEHKAWTNTLARASVLTAGCGAGPYVVIVQQPQQASTSVHARWRCRHHHRSKAKRSCIWVPSGNCVDQWPDWILPLWDSPPFLQHLIWAIMFDFVIIAHTVWESCTTTWGCLQALGAVRTGVGGLRKPRGVWYTPAPLANVRR